MKIAIFDSGIDASHEAFGSNCYGEPDCRIAMWRDYIGRDERPTDCSFVGHGTSVAAVAAGRAGKFVGVAPNAKLYIYRLYGCRGKVSVSEFNRALEDAIYVDKVDVINLSFGELVSSIAVRGNDGQGSFASDSRNENSSNDTEFHNDEFEDYNLRLQPEDIGFDWPQRTALELAVTSAAEAAPYVHIVSVAGNFGPHVFSVASPGVSNSVLSVAAMDTGAVLVRRMRVYQPQKPEEKNGPLGKGTGFVGQKYEDANFLFSLDWPLTCQDISKKNLLIVDYSSPTSNCDAGNDVLRLSSGKVILVYLGSCALRATLDAFGSAGAQVVLVAVNVTSLSSTRARERVGATLVPKWGKLTQIDAERLFGNTPGMQLLDKVEISGIDRVFRGVEEASISSFSSYGPAAGLGIKPQISAFGTVRIFIVNFSYIKIEKIR